MRQQRSTFVGKHTRARLLCTLVLSCVAVVLHVAPQAQGATWVDPFEDTLRAGWKWLNAGDTAYTSLSERTGYLRIATQAGGGRPPRGSVVRPAPADDFVIETRVLFAPQDNFQRAGLLIYGDMENYLVLSRAYCGYLNYGCVLNGIYFDSTTSTENFAAPTESQDTAWLRLTKTGTQIRAEYSEDGTTWQSIGTHTFAASGSLSIGLVSDGDRDGSGRASAYFDHFRVEWPDDTTATAPQAQDVQDTTPEPAAAVSQSRITNVRWLLGDRFVEVTFDAFPAWGEWTMYVSGQPVSMEGGPGQVVVRPNGPVHSATGVFIGTDPWVTSLTQVEFPCEGTLQFDIPGAGRTNEYSFSLGKDGCCTALDCAQPAVMREELRPELDITVDIGPPVAELISVTEISIDGYATVVGAAGAVYPRSFVWVQNLDARNVTVVTADADGGFHAELFCPPGAALMVKHDPRGDHIRPIWDQLVAGRSPADLAEITTLWGTIIPVAPPAEGTSFAQPFSVVGSLRQGSWWAGFWVEGEIQLYSFSFGEGFRADPGDTGQISGTIRFVSEALRDVDLDSVSAMLHFDLRQLFGSDGYAEPWGIWFDGQLFTPTGLPIEMETNGVQYGIGGTELRNFRRVSERCVEASFQHDFAIPQWIVPGTYRPKARIQAEGIPLSLGEKPVDVWYHHDPNVALPPIAVGDPADPWIPWTLFGDEPMNSQRGVTAREDIGRFEMVNRVVYPANRAVLSPIDEFTGEPTPYRIDLGSHWISASERRTPCPPYIPFSYPSGQLSVRIEKPDGTTETLGPAPLAQAVVRTPTTVDGGQTGNGTGQISDLYHASTMAEASSYVFDQYGDHVIELSGSIEDVYGNSYPIGGTYDVLVARVLDLDPAQLPTTPYEVGDWFAPGLHVFPAVPAQIDIRVEHLPYSDPERAIVHVITGTANRYGVFLGESADAFRFTEPGEFRVDITARYEARDGTIWAGTMTWGNVVANKNPSIEAHGRRGMDYHGSRIDDMPAWFEVFDLPEDKVGIEVYYPYFSGDIHWGNEDKSPGDSIHPVITIRDLTSDQMFYDILADHLARNRSGLRWPPEPCWDESGPTCLNERFAVGEAPLFSTTSDGSDPVTYPEKIDLFSYWYASSERPDVHVREVISDDNMGTGYWRFDDTYGYQIGESAEGDLEGDLKWEFGGAVFRVPEDAIAEYAIYSSLWVLLPHDDPIGARVTPPFQDATGASINGGPIMTLLGDDIDMLFLPKALRPGDVLEVDDTISFSGHVGPPLDSRVDVVITSPSGVEHRHEFRANRIGWVYDPSFDFPASEPGRWRVSVHVEHDRPYVGNGVIPQSHNTGTVLGTSGGFSFYVVPKGSEPITIVSPNEGRLPWPTGKRDMRNRIRPIVIQGEVSAGVQTVHVTVHDKGVVMTQTTVTPSADGNFSFTYDAKRLNRSFPFLSLTAHEGIWEGLADEVTISFLAEGGGTTQAAVVTLIGEEVFLPVEQAP